MSILDYPLVSEIINNLWWFQTESVVPIFKEISIWILILFAISEVIGIVSKMTLNKSEKRVAIGVILFPITLAFWYGLLYSFGSPFGFDFTSINITDIFSHSIKNWWFFLIFWPVVLLQIPLGLVGKKGEGGGNILVRTIFAPIYEEFAFRLLAINTMFLITNSIEISLFISAIAFTLIHLPNMDRGKWVGPVWISSNFTLGMIMGIMAINYGLIFAIIFHSLSNLTARLLGEYF